MKWYETVSDLPSVQSAWDDPALADDAMLATFGAQLEDAKAPPAIPTWEQVALGAIDDQIEQVVVGDASPEDGCAGYAERGRVDRYRAVDRALSATAAATRTTRAAPSRDRHVGARRSSGGASPCRSWCCSPCSWLGPIVASFGRRASPISGGGYPQPFQRRIRRRRELRQCVHRPHVPQGGRNTAVYVLVAVPLTMGLGLLVAVGLNQGVVRFRTLFRAGYYLP